MQKYIIILKPPNLFEIIFLVFFPSSKEEDFSGVAESKEIPDLIRRDIPDLIEGDTL